MWTVLYSALNCVVVWGCILLYIWSVSHDVNVNFLWIFKPLCLFIVMLLQLNEWTVEPHWDCLKTLQCPSSSQAIMWSAQRQLPPHCQPNILAGTLGPNRCLWRHSTLLPESLWRHNGHACFYGRIHYGGNSVAYVLCSEQVLGTGIADYFLFTHISKLPSVHGDIFDYILQNVSGSSPISPLLHAHHLHNHPVHCVGHSYASPHETLTIQ